MMRIKRPGKTNLLKTAADFERKYKEYLSHF
jgi:hypothetical protein